MEKINNYLKMNPDIIEILKDNGNGIDLYDNGDCSLMVVNNGVTFGVIKLDFTDLDTRFYEHELNDIDITAYKINEVSFLQELKRIYNDLVRNPNPYVEDIMRDFDDATYIGASKLVENFRYELDYIFKELQNFGFNSFEEHSVKNSTKYTPKTKDELQEPIKKDKEILTAKDVFKMFEQLDEKEAIKFFFAYQGFSVQDGDDWIIDPNNPYIEKMAEYYVTNERKWKNCDGFINRELIDDIQYEFHKSLGVDDIDEAVEKLSKNDDDKYAVCFEFHAEGEKAEHGEDDWEFVTNDVERRESTLLDSVKSALSQICDNEFHDGNLKNVLMSIDESNSLIKLCDTENQTLVLISKLGKNEEIWERNYDEHMSNEYDDFAYEIENLAENENWQKLDIKVLSDLIVKADNIDINSVDLKSFCKEIDDSFMIKNSKSKQK